MSSYGDVTDEEFREIRDRIGDMALENPQLVVRLVDDLRRQRGRTPHRGTLH